MIHETAQIEALAAAIDGPRASTVIAGPPRSLAGATLANGYKTPAVTVCDIHRPTLCHVTPEVVPPALAVAEQRDLGGRDLLVAIAAGLETVVRVGAGMRYPSMRARGWHSPGVIGPFGGAAAVGSLLGLDAGRVHHSLSPAGTPSARTGGSGPSRCVCGRRRARSSRSSPRCSLWSKSTTCVRTTSSGSRSGCR